MAECGHYILLLDVCPDLWRDDVLRVSRGLTQGTNCTSFDLAGYLLRSILYSYSALSAHGRRAQALRYGLRTDGDAAKPSTSLFPDLRVNDPEHCPHNREKIRL